MTVSKTIFRAVLRCTGVSILCALGLLFLGVMSLAAVYLTELSPSMQNIGSVQDAEQLFDSVYMTFPQSFEGMIPDSLSLAAAWGSECGILSN